MILKGNILLYLCGYLTLYASAAPISSDSDGTQEVPSGATGQQQENSFSFDLGSLPFQDTEDPIGFFASDESQPSAISRDEGSISTHGSRLPESAADDFGFAVDDPNGAPQTESSQKGETEKNHTCCAICLSDFIEGERVVSLTSCGHEYHDACLQPWIDRHTLSTPTCPMCRKPFA